MTSARPSHQSVSSFRQLSFSKGSTFTENTCASLRLRSSKPWSCTTWRFSKETDKWTWLTLYAKTKPAGQLTDSKLFKTTSMKNARQKNLSNRKRRKLWLPSKRKPSWTKQGWSSLRSQKINGRWARSLMSCKSNSLTIVCCSAWSRKNSAPTRPSATQTNTTSSTSTKKSRWSISRVKARGWASQTTSPVPTSLRYLRSEINSSTTSNDSMVLSPKDSDSNSRRIWSMKLRPIPKKHQSVWIKSLAREKLIASP